jgi:thioredoxin 1
MSKIIEVTDQNFVEEVLNSDLPTEVDFWARWCGSCMKVGPIYEKLAGEYEGNFKFCKINVDKNPEITTEYHIRNIPIQIFFADGDKIDHIRGLVTEDMIRSKVEKILKKFPPDIEGRV